MKTTTFFRTTILAMLFAGASLSASPTNSGTVRGYTSLATTDCPACFVPKPTDYFGCYIVANGVNMHIAQPFAQYVSGDLSTVTCHGDLEPGACATFAGEVVDVTATSEDPPFQSYQLEVTSWTLLSPSECEP